MKPVAWKCPQCANVSFLVTGKHRRRWISARPGDVHSLVVEVKCLRCNSRNWTSCAPAVRIFGDMNPLIAGR